MNHIVRVYKCDLYEISKLKNIIKENFKNIGIKDKRVLLKPNILQAHNPGQNVTTNPVLLQAAAEVFIEKGARCKIGDSPSGWGIENARNAAEETGVMNVCRNLSIDFDFFDGQDVKMKKVENGKIYKRFYLPKSYFTYDVVVNVPKLKTHSLTGFTLGVKNMMGIIPGLGKADMHRKAPHPKRFAQAIADLYSLVVPDFTILDGIEAMDGDGPVNGGIKKLNRIFISKNTNALDSVVERMCGINPKKVILTREIWKRGLGNIENVKVKKDYSESDEGFKNFKVPIISKIGSKIPEWVVNMFSGSLLHFPKVNMHLCSECGMCAKICPVNAIELKTGEPFINKNNCIKCFCCAERCPEKAIYEDKRFLAKIFS
ncbi:MAG: DUF362 domain-containing protein [Elusimicrobiota bacterium]